MHRLLSLYHAIQDFIELGGPVLWFIFAACLLKCLWLNQVCFVFYSVL